MSSATLEKLASSTVSKTDAILRDWHEAFERGDVAQAQVTSIIDALLDLRTAACLKAVPPGKKDKVS